MTIQTDVCSFSFGCKSALTKIQSRDYISADMMMFCVNVVEMICSRVDLWIDWTESVMGLAEEAGTFLAVEVDLCGPCTKNDSRNNGLLACFLPVSLRFIIYSGNLLLSVRLLFHDWSFIYKGNKQTRIHSYNLCNSCFLHKSGFAGYPICLYERSSAKILLLSDALHVTSTRWIW